MEGHTIAHNAPQRKRGILACLEIARACNGREERDRGSGVKSVKSGKRAVKET